MNKKIWISLISAFSLSAISANGANPPEMTVTTLDNSKEKHDRNVDQAALAAQRAALRQLNVLAKRYRGTAKEAALIARIAEIHYQNAGIYFRLAHADSHKKNRKKFLGEHKKSLRNTISILNSLIKRFPRYEQMEIAYFMRGKSHEELEQKKSAAFNYKIIVKQYPHVPEADSALMSLAQFAIDDNQHQLAIQYLNQIEAKPASRFYPFALFKLAWSYYNLQNKIRAIEYLETHVRFYTDKADRENGLTSSDFSIRENSLLDIALFHFDRVERDINGFDPSDNLSYFKDLGAGDSLGKMNLRFAKLLRSHSHDRQLHEWKSHLMAEVPELPETLGVVITTFEHQYNKRRFKDISSTAKDMVTLYENNPTQIKGSEAYAKAQKLLLDTATEIRKATLRNKNSRGVVALSHTLADLYLAFTEIVEDDDPRVHGAHYNLAETLFEIRQYARATHHYRWIVDRWKSNLKMSLKDIRIKAISSRYRELDKMKALPKKLSPIALSEASDSDLPPKVSEWIAWIDKYEDKTKKLDSTFLNFKFEAARTLYHYKHLPDAIERTEEFAMDHPRSKFAIPSASLTLDTLIASKDWKQSHEMARDFLKVKAWKKGKFRARLFKTAADSYYKLIEIEDKKEDGGDVFDMVGYFTKNYPGSPRVEDVLFLAAGTATRLDDDEKADEMYSMLIAKFPKSKNTGSSLIARSQLLEKKYQFARASKDLERFMKLNSLKDPSEKLKLKRKILYFTWLSGSPVQLQSKLRDKTICSKGEILVDCDRYNALSKINQPKFLKKDSLFAFDRAINAPKPNRPIWAAAALREQSHFRFPDRMLMVRILAGRWNELDVVIQASLNQKLKQSVPYAFELNRGALKKFAKLSANERAIQRRVKLMQEMEETAGKVLNLNWTDVKAKVLSEISQSYLDFTEELSLIPAPKGLPANEIAAYQDSIREIIFPFEEKGQDLRRTAFDLASSASVERKTFDSIAKQFFQDNPSQAKDLQGDVRFRVQKPFGLAWLEELDPDLDWDDAHDEDERTSNDPRENWQANWVYALKSKNWQFVEYLSQKASDKKIIPENSLKLLNAIVLKEAGAQGEGLATLHAIRDRLEPESKQKATFLLLAHALESMDRKRVRREVSRLSEFREDSNLAKVADSDDEAFLIAYSTQWSGGEIPAEQFLALLEDATGASKKDQRLWAKKALATAQKKIDQDKAGAKKVARK